MESGAHAGRVRHVLYLDHGTKPVGGGQVNTLAIIKSLDRSRFAPLVLSARENAFTHDARAAGVEVMIHPLPDVLTELGRWSVRYDPYHLALYLRIAFRASAEIARIGDARGIDIMHPCDNLMRTLSVLAARRRPLPIVCPIMEEFTPALTSRVLRAIYLRRMDYLLPVSEQAAAFFRQGGKHRAKVEVTYTGIDLDEFSPDVTKARRAERAGQGDTMTFGIVGRLVPLKGHRDLLLALHRYRRMVAHPFRCLVVGDGPNRAELEAMTQTLGLQQEVCFMGFRRDVSAAMAEMDVLVAPSLNEASSRVVLEAAAMEIPSVATRVGGLPEMVVDGVTGLLIDARDVESLARALVTMSDPAARARMGAAGLDRVRRQFSSTAIARKLEAIYDRVLGA